MARQKRKDGRYQVQIDLPLQYGDTTRRRKYFYGKTLTEARKKKDDFLATFGKNKSVKVNPDIRLSEWVAVWLADVQGTYTANGYSGLKSASNRIVRSIPNLKVRDVQPHHIQTYMSSLAGMSKSTINKQRGVLKQIFHYAVDNGIIAESPCRGIRSPKGSYIGHRVLTEDERNTLLQHWRDCRGATWALVMLYTGLRRGELFALTPADVDFEKMVLRVNKSAVLEEGSRVKEPKTRSGNRAVPIFPVIAEPLRIAVEKCGERLFTDRWGDPVNAVTFRSGWDTMRSKLGIDIQAHDLRYSYASMLHDADVDVLTASRLLGHADIKITLGIYTKLSEAKEQTEVAKLREFVSRGCQMAVKQ